MRVFLFLSIVGCVICAVPAEANACTPWEPEALFTVPPDGEVHPHNSAFIIFGRAMDPEGLEATVDDIPVELVVDEERSDSRGYFVWGQAYQTLALELNPPLQPGQDVHVFGELCNAEAEMFGETTCTGFDLQFSTGPADREVPDLDFDLWYDVYDHGQVSTVFDSCGSNSAQYSVDVRVDVENEQAVPPSLFELYRRPRDEPGQWGRIAHQWWFEDGPWVHGFSFRDLPEVVAEFLPLGDAFCFELRTQDLAGNPGPSLERCPPCRDQLGDNEDGGFISMFPDTAPPYSNTWLYPDGYCPQSVLDEEGSTDGTDGTGGDTGDEETTGATGSTSRGGTGGSDGSDGGSAGGSGGGNGGGCTIAARPTSGSAWFLMLGMLALRRRYR